MTNKTKAGDLDPFGRVWTLKGDLAAARCGRMESGVSESPLPRRVSRRTASGAAGGH
jgi:hypothetical protein